MAGLELPVDDAARSVAMLWALCLRYHSGMGSAAEVDVQWTKLFEWGNENNPDVTSFDPATPATTREKQRATGLLAVAGGKPPLRS